jgi:hypothetical protein
LLNNLSPEEICDFHYNIYNQILNLIVPYGGYTRGVVSLEVGSQIYRNTQNNPCDCNLPNGYWVVSPTGSPAQTTQIVWIIQITDCTITDIIQCDGSDGNVTPISGGSGGTGGSGGSGGNGGNNPGGGPNPSSVCECTAVRTISGFQGTAFYTDCDGNPAQITVPGGTGVAGSACFCRQPNTPVTGAVIVEACQSSFSQGTLNNICNSTISCS